MKSIARRLRQWLIGGTLCGVVSLTVAVLCLRSLGTILDVSSPPERTDYVVCLQGDINVRPFVTAALITHGYAAKALVLSLGPDETPAQSAWSTPHDVVQKILISRGVDREQIVTLQPGATSTYAEIAAIKDFLEGQPQATATIVTSAFHTRRTRWTVRHIFGSQAQRIRIVGAPLDNVDADYWWRTEEGFVTYTPELFKFAFYLMYYGRAVPVTIAIVVATVMVLLVWRSIYRRYGERGPDSCQ